MELARGIEPPTCGLQNSDRSNSDNLTLQETTTQEIGEMGLDGGSLSCPGSSVVADCDDERGKFEASTGSLTICLALVESLSTQSPTEDQERVEEPIKPDRTG